jgi:hypothetical protein
MDNFLGTHDLPNLNQKDMKHLNGSIMRKTQDWKDSLLNSTRS